MSVDNAFTNSLKEAAGDQWNRIVNHKFTTEIGNGSIDRDVLKKYLIQDHRLLNSFVILIASIIGKARCLEDRIPLCQFLGLVTAKENTYFERCFEKLGCTKEERDQIPDDPCTTRFMALMKEVSVGGNLAEMLSVMVVCEWSYQTWGERVLGDIVRDDFMCYEWVDLHSGEHFGAFVAHLRGLLEKEGGLIDEEGKERCKRRFAETIQLEEDFFENIYVLSKLKSRRPWRPKIVRILSRRWRRGKNHT